MGMTAMLNNVHAELIIQNNPVNIIGSEQQPTLVNNWQTQPSEASLEKLIKVLHIDRMIHDLLAQRQQAATVLKGLPNALPTDNNAGIFSRHAQKQIKNIFIKYGAIVGQQLDQPKSEQELLQAYKNIAKKTYTQDEVNALNQFYDTPMGQSILSKQSQVSMEFIQMIMPSMIGDTDKLDKDIPDLQKDIEKIFK